MVNVAVLGYGTIGSGVVEVLQTNTEIIAQRAGEEIAVKYILDLRDFPGDPNADKVVHDYDIIDKDEDVQVVVECMGGVEPAYTFVKRALLNGRSVATSNKELVAKHGAELIAIAHEKNINFLFEASVGGGIPIIRPLVQCLTADVIEEVSGILNGTTNYMLTRMKEEGISFEEALKEAQEKVTQNFIRKQTWKVMMPAVRLQSYLLLPLDSRQILKISIQKESQALLQKISAMLQR